MSTRDMLNDKNVQIGGAAFLGLILGGAAGYSIASRHGVKIIDREIRAVKEYYRNPGDRISHHTIKQGVESDPTELLKSYSEKADEYKSTDTKSPIVPKGNRGDTAAAVAYNQVEARDDTDDVEDLEAEIAEKEEIDPDEDNPEENLLRNIFEAQDPDDVIPDWDYEEELVNRSPDVPYVISLEEFTDGSEGFEQTTVTYFEGDDVLSDESDKIIEDIANTVSEETLYRFGHGSKDNNVVYVRNEKLNLDFEILRSHRKYAQEVLGFIEHSNKPGIRKFRNNDW